MIIAKIQVNGVRARVVYRKNIPAGIIGAQVELDYAEDIWKGLRKTVVFKGAVTKDVVTDANLVTIPAEAVSVPRITLKAGVYGVDADGNLAIPTLWADLGRICDSANPSGDTTTDPSLPVWAQLQAMIGDLDKLDTTAKENLVAAINEVRATGSDGKSAYQYAQDGGYTGTEAEFAEKLAAEIPVIDDTLTQSEKAADAAVVGDRLGTLSEDKVDKDQGAENAGKALIIGADGMVVTGNVTLSYEETLSLLIEEDVLPAVYNADGAILTDQNRSIVLRY